MKSHIGADVESGLVHHVHGTAVNVADVTQVAELLHGGENAVYADAGYTGVEKREEHENREVIWQIAARRSTYSRLNKRSLLYKAKRKIERLQSADTSQGRTSFPGDQESVWLCESTVSWADEKHGSVNHAVCPLKPLDGLKAADGYGQVTRITQRNGLRSPTTRCAREVSR